MLLIMQDFFWKKYIIELSGGSGYDESKLKEFSKGKFYDEKQYEKTRDDAGTDYVKSERSKITDLQSPVMNLSGIYAQPGNNSVDAGAFDRWWRPVIIDLKSAAKDTAKLALENQSKLNGTITKLDGTITPKIIGTPAEPAHLDINTTFGYKGDKKYKLSDYFNDGNDWRETVDGKITRLEEYKNNLDDLLNGKDGKEGIKTKVSKLEGMDAKVSKLEGMDAKVSELERINTKVSELEGMDAKVSELDDKIKQLGENVGEVVQILSKLSSK